LLAANLALFSQMAMALCKNQPKVCSFQLIYVKDVSMPLFSSQAASAT
jgi:hypothetical protein